MHAEVQGTLRETLRSLLSRLEPARTCQDLRLVWKRRSEGGWGSTYEHVQSLGFSWDRNIDWEQEAEPVRRALLEHHPDHVGLVGLWSAGGGNLTARDLVRACLIELWRRHRSFSICADLVDALIAEVSDFINRPSIQMQGIAPLINLKVSGGEETIPLGSNISIRKLSEEEVTEFYGGSVLSLTLKFQPFIHDWALVGEWDEPKILGREIREEDGQAFRRFLERLDRALLALRTFKRGPVGYQELFIAPKSFAPVWPSWIKRTFGSESVPFGRYELSPEEIPLLRTHVAQLAQEVHPSLEVACSRLGLAAARTNPRDQLIDAVIGLEAVLLGGPERYRGELRFRFGANYASLQVSQRLEAFYLARDIYDLRSQIVHGSDPGGEARIGGRQMTLAEAASRAVEMLREVTKRFLDQGSRPRYLQQGFWESNLFDVPDE
jgi:hypothetical protein